MKVTLVNMLQSIGRPRPALEGADSEHYTFVPHVATRLFKEEWLDRYRPVDNTPDGARIDADFRSVARGIVAAVEDDTRLGRAPVSGPARIIVDLEKKHLGGRDPWFDPYYGEITQTVLAALLPYIEREGEARWGLPVWPMVYRSLRSVAWGAAFSGQINPQFAESYGAERVRPILQTPSLWLHNYIHSSTAKAWGRERIWTRLNTNYQLTQFASVGVRPREIVAVLWVSKDGITARQMTDYCAGMAEGVYSHRSWLEGMGCELKLAVAAHHGWVNTLGPEDDALDRGWREFVLRPFESVFGTQETY